MSLPDRKLKTPRLTHDQDRRLARAAEAANLSEQAFMIGAIMRAVEDIETQRDQSRDKQRRGERNYRRNEPIGLGLFRDKPRESPAPEAPQPSQVVVNVGKQDGGTDDIVTRLADDVTGGPGYNRDDRLQATLETIRRLARTETERDDMTQRLKDIVNARTKAKSPSFWEEMKDMIR